MIYLDNAATTLYKPKEVYIRSNEVLRYFSANAGRGGHRASLKAAEIIFSARETVSKWLGIEKCENIVFTFGCTDALNIVISGLFNPGDKIITTCYSHNSVLRPLENLKNTKSIEYACIFPKNGFEITAEEIEKEITPNTRALVVNYVSNVTGYVENIVKLGHLCKKHSLLFIVDAAQAAGTQPLNAKEMNIDYICIAGHKGLYAPQGIGVLAIGDNAPLPRPLRFGGTGTKTFDLIQPADMPEYLESGTLSVQSIAALEEGIKFVQRHDILSYELFLAETLKNGLLSIPGITLYSPVEYKSGVIAFNFKDRDSSKIADILDKKYSLCVRGGYHCAPMVHKMLKTENQGAVRLSVSYFNTEAEITAALNAIASLNTIAAL